MRIWRFIWVLFPCGVVSLDWSNVDAWIYGLDWYNEVVSGEHFTDVVGSTDGRRNVIKNSILVLYRENCPPMVTREALPSVSHLYFLRHDLVRSSENIWYRPIPDDDLKRRYVSNLPDPRCMEAFFFPRGSSLDEAPVRWDSSQESLDVWVWNCIHVEITFDNQFGDTLIVEQIGKKRSPQLLKQFIYDGETLKIKSYPGYEIQVKLTDRLTMVFRLLVGETNRTYTLHRHIQSPDFESARLQEERQTKWHTYYVDMHYMRYVQMIKQPIFVHNYTETGYTKIRMPTEMLNYVTTYFEANYKNIRKEGLTPGELLVINKDTVEPSMVDMTPEFKKEVARHLYLILEEWCNCKLRFNFAYGIREYYRGNVLHKHVDSIVTHVISALINVHQDLAGAEDWKLEVISYDGVRREIPMKAGDMVLYESASLIHGRPRTFLSKRYANMFFHFSPIEGWNYRKVGQEISNSDHPWKESLDRLSFSKLKDSYVKIKTEL